VLSRSRAKRWCSVRRVGCCTIALSTPASDARRRSRLLAR
jgi:hypothetical protein